jgi:hypothetical protein
MVCNCPYRGGVTSGGRNHRLEPIGYRMSW